MHVYMCILSTHKKTNIHMHTKHIYIKAIYAGLKWDLNDEIIHWIYLSKELGNQNKIHKSQEPKIWHYSKTRKSVQPQTYKMIQWKIQSIEWEKIHHSKGQSPQYIASSFLILSEFQVFRTVRKQIGLVFIVALKHSN